MKKIKFLPSILMLVLSIAVLGLGVYAANPSTNTVTGSIKVNASSYPIAVRCLLDGDVIENHTTIRSGITWTNGLSNLEFTTDTALTVDEVAPRVLTLEVTNLSNVNLAAYYLTDANTLTAENKATINSISTVEHLVSGTDTVVKATKTGYTKLEPGATVEMTVTMSLYQMFYEELDPVGFSFVLNVEECQDSLVTMEQGITVNTNGLDVTLTPSVNHGYTVETGMVTESSAGRYSTTNLAIDDDYYPNQYLTEYKRYRTTNVKFTIQNNEEYGITADINAVLNEEKIQVTTLGNAYIGAGESGEVSLQFTPLRDSNLTGSEIISDVVSSIDIYKATNEVTSESDIYSRIKYNKDGYNGGTMKHYIEYGVNPFKPTEKLKWYIWGVKVGDSDLRVISDTDVVDGNKLIRSTTELPREYYFISECVLDISLDETSLMYNNEYDYMVGTAYYNVDSDDYYASKYEGSLLQRYLSGTTQLTGEACVGDCIYVSTGSPANFYEFYGLTNDPIYNQIIGRLLSEMYDSDSYASNGDGPYDDVESEDLFNSLYAGMSDKFWALSYSEQDIMCGEYDDDLFGENGGGLTNGTACQLSTGYLSSQSNFWWLRSPKYDSRALCVIGNGGCEGMDDCADVDADYVGIRPAFKIAL